jgi:hypothetical protein
MRAAPPFLIITTTPDPSDITSKQVVECLDYYYYETLLANTDGIYVRDLFAAHKLGPKEIEPDEQRTNPKNFDTMPSVITRLFADSVAPNDAYTINVANANNDTIFEKGTANDKGHISILLGLLGDDDKKLAALIFAFILLSIHGIKTGETYTSFDFSANLQTQPEGVKPSLNKYTNLSNTNNLYEGEEQFVLDTQTDLKNMATSFYTPSTRNSLYIFKSPLLGNIPFLSQVESDTDDPNTSSQSLFRIDMSQVDRTELSSNGNLRAKAGATVESMLGFERHGSTGYILTLITNKDLV